MSPIRMRKTVRVGSLLRFNVTARSVLGFLRGRSAPWSSVSVGPRGFAYNSRRRTARVDLPGPLSYETGPFGGRDERDDADLTRQFSCLHGVPADTRCDLGCDDAPPPPPPDVGDEDALRETCPRCGARPGNPCRTRTSGAQTHPHMPRVELARTDRHYREGPWAPAEIPPWGTPPPDPTGDNRP